MALLDNTIFMDTLAKALTLFLVLDAPGNAGMIGALLKNYSLRDQKRILRREMLISFALMVSFYFFGAGLLDILGVSHSAVQITGGLVLFFFALTLLFPRPDSNINNDDYTEPFIVPIAVPFVAGPSCLATIILFSHESSGMLSVLIAIFVAWTASALIIIAAPKLLSALGIAGQNALERMMGLVCSLIGVKMLLGGLLTFLETRF